MGRALRGGWALLAGWAFAAALAVAPAPPAGATQIEFLWQATGTDSISVLPGEEVVLEAVVVVEDPGIHAVSVSALATPGLVEAVDFEVCPLAAGNSIAGKCGSAFGSAFDPLGAGNIVLNEQDAGTIDPDPEGLSGSFAAAEPQPLDQAITGGTFVLAHISYSVIGVGSGEVLPFYRGGVDGAIEVGNEFFVPLADGADITSGASLLVIPEPGTLGLLALGIGALASLRRPHP